MTRDGQTTVIDDVASEEFSPYHQTQLSAWKTRSFIVAPIQSDGKLWGLLAVHQCIDARNWLEDEVKLIRTIANQVGIAIAHTELLTQALAQKALLTKKNAELQKARWGAEENVHLKSEFLTRISHELRTPLNGIIGALDLVLGDPEIWDENRQLLSMGLQSSEKLLHIIDDILDFSMPESDKLSIQCQPISLFPLVSSVCAGFKQESDQKQITIHIDISEDQQLQANTTRLRQVLNQLLANALKFTTQAGYIHIRAMHQAALSMVHIEIHDTGIGVPLDQQKKLFQPFVQADGSSNRRYEGTGLGLAICKQLIERMGGQISLFSAGRGTGTSVHIQLPIVKYPTIRAST